MPGDQLGERAVRRRGQIDFSARGVLMQQEFEQRMVIGEA